MALPEGNLRVAQEGHVMERSSYIWYLPRDSSARHRLATRLPESGCETVYVKAGGDEGYAWIAAKVGVWSWVTPQPRIGFTRVPTWRDFPYEGFCAACDGPMMSQHYWKPGQAGSQGPARAS